LGEFCKEGMRERGFDMQGNPPCDK
jgi:hypothetical protein